MVGRRWQQSRDSAAPVERWPPLPPPPQDAACEVDVRTIQTISYSIYLSLLMLLFLRMVVAVVLVVVTLQHRQFVHWR